LCFINKYFHRMHVKTWVNSVYRIIRHRIPTSKMVVGIAYCLGGCRGISDFFFALFRFLTLSVLLKL
jgi:hypothetical protein